MKRTTPAGKGGRCLKAEVGFEPTNHGFAIRSLRPLGYSAKDLKVYRMNIEGPPVGIRFRVDLGERPFGRSRRFNPDSSLKATIRRSIRT